MKILKKISENEMIAEFLKGEIKSKRFGKDITGALEKEKKSKNIIIGPNLNNKRENTFRKKLLFKVRKEFFEGFPADIRWYEAIIQKQELKKVKYIDFSYWNKLSDETRLPIRAAKNVKAGIKIFDVSNKGFFEIQSEIKKGKKMPLMIFIAQNKKSQIVILEGHARLTAYFLNEKYIPKEMKIIIGYSGKLTEWDLY